MQVDGTMAGNQDMDQVQGFYHPVERDLSDSTLADIDDFLEKVAKDSYVFNDNDMDPSSWIDWEMWVNEHLTPTSISTTKYDLFPELTI